MSDDLFRELAALVPLSPGDRNELRHQRDRLPKGDRTARLITTLFAELARARWELDKNTETNT